MTASPAFFRDAEVVRLLERAAAVAATPVSLHYKNTVHQELRIQCMGGCAACQWLQRLPAGTKACWRSRNDAAALALRQDTPVTFVCHFGFTCVSAPVLPEENYVVTFGPYIPDEASEAVAYEVVQALNALDFHCNNEDDLPFSLGDVRRVPGGVVSAVAEWLVEGIRDAFKHHAWKNASEAPAEESSPEETPSAPIQETHDASGADTWLCMAALALLCGRTRHARAALSDILEEAALEPRPTAERLQARLIRGVSQILEAAERMGGDIEKAWQRYTCFVEAVRGLDDPPVMLKQAMRILRCVHPITNNKRPVMPAYLPMVVDRVHASYRKNVSLVELAVQAQVVPSTITRALECRINATYSESVGMVRMAQARRLLRNTRLTATKISRRVGIQDQSNFSKMFLRFTGCSPSAYRRRLGL